MEAGGDQYVHLGDPGFLGDVVDQVGFSHFECFKSKNGIFNFKILSVVGTFSASRVRFVLKLIKSTDYLKNSM